MMNEELDSLTVEEQEAFERNTARRDYMGAQPDQQYSMYVMALGYPKDIYFQTIVECHDVVCVEPAVA